MLKNTNDDHFFHFMISILWKNMKQLSAYAIASILSVLLSSAGVGGYGANCLSLETKTVKYDKLLRARISASPKQLLTN